MPTEERRLVKKKDCYQRTPDCRRKKTENSWRAPVLGPTSNFSFQDKNISVCLVALLLKILDPPSQKGRKVWITVILAWLRMVECLQERLQRYFMVAFFSIHMKQLYFCNFCLWDLTKYLDESHISKHYPLSYKRHNRQ